MCNTIESGESVVGLILQCLGQGSAVGAVGASWLRLARVDGSWPNILKVASTRQKQRRVASLDY